MSVYGKIKYKEPGKKIIEKLAEKGFSTYWMRNADRDKTPQALNESTLQKLRRDEIIAPDPLAKVCYMLQCQPGDLLEWQPDPPPAADQKTE